jgi:hypothetical protein
MPYETNVFLNSPFDSDYDSLFYAIIFAIHDCGFVARCAREVDDSGDVRIEKIYKLIRDSKYGIHDISLTTLDKDNKLPRFNMPLELGIFLGARKFGDAEQQDKKCLVLDTERYRYHMFCSDIAGQDIHGHSGNLGKAIARVRDWLVQWIAADVTVPGGKAIVRRYGAFEAALPKMCSEAECEPDELTYVDKHKMIVGWLKENAL